MSNYLKHLVVNKLLSSLVCPRAGRVCLFLLFIPPLEWRVEDAEGPGGEEERWWSVYKSEERDLLDVSIRSAQTARGEEGPHMHQHVRAPRDQGGA